MTNDALRIREKIGYGFGDTACSMFWSTFTMFLLFFYTDVFGLPVATAGTLLLATRIWDTFFDPVVGVVADRTRTRWGKFRPYLMWGSIPFGIIGALTFITPGLGPSGKLIYAYVTYTLMMMIYSAVNVPYFALSGVMTNDPRERTVLASYRMFFAFFGGLISQWLTNPLVNILGNGNKAAGFSWTVSVYAALAVMLLVTSFLWTRERIQPISAAKSPLRSDLKDLMRNWPCQILSLMSIWSQINLALRNGSIMYYFKYYVGDEKLAGTYMVVGSVSSIAGVLSAKWLAIRFGRKKAFVGGLIVQVVATAACYWVGPRQYLSMFLLQGLLNVAHSATVPLGLSMWADAADYSEWKTGRRATGLVMSIAMMAGKTGWALGGALCGWILAWYGFRPNMVQTPDMQTALRLLLSFFPAIPALGMTITMLAYPLNEPRMKSIQQELEERRRAGSQASS